MQNLPGLNFRVHAAGEAPNVSVSVLLILLACVHNLVDIAAARTDPPFLFHAERFFPCIVFHLFYPSFLMGMVRFQQRVENAQRAHSPLLAVGLASEFRNGQKSLHLGDSLSACDGLQGSSMTSVY